MSPSRPGRPPAPRPAPAPRSRPVVRRSADASDVPDAPDATAEQMRTSETPGTGEHDHAADHAADPSGAERPVVVPPVHPVRALPARPVPGTAPTVAVRVPPVVSATSAARFAERARRRRTLARRQVLAIAGAVLVLVGLAWVLFWSPVLALDASALTLEIEGTGTVVASDDVQAVVDARDGTPLPRLDTGRLRADVLDVPGVREASVARDWPHGLTVTIVAREPVAAVPAEGRSGYALLDEEGVQVGHVTDAPDDLPVVDVPAGDRRTLQAVLTVVEQLPSQLATRVASVAARTQDTVSMQLRGGLRVDWGSSSDTELKSAVLTTLLGSDAVEGATLVDVSAPRLPIVR